MLRTEHLGYMHCDLILLTASEIAVQVYTLQKDFHLNTFYHMLTSLIQVWESVPTLPSQVKAGRHFPTTKQSNEKSMPLDVITGACVPRSSPFPTS